MGFIHFAIAYGYTSIFALLGLEYLILVVPGETLLTTLGVLAHTQQLHFSLPLLIVVASFGSFTGSIITYFIGRTVGRPVILRYGKYVFITEKRLQQTERLFHRQAIWTLLITKYIAVIRDIIPYVAGVNKLGLKVYVPIQLLASFLWIGTFLLGGNLIKLAATSIYHHWRIELIPAVIVLALCVWGYRAIHKRMIHI
ncbi:DedA family protein [Alicyclobacillus suci]|uniref:DedA family protein n=1 Tax=Alicyclobacillus suci TaxID=2816080 RepID=UPI001A9014D9|nr:DedA family protein [Alicyclobacillus suci]